MQNDLFGANLRLRLEPPVTPKVQDRDTLILENAAHEKTPMTVDGILFRAHDGNTVRPGAPHQSFDPRVEEVLTGDARIDDVPFRVVEVLAARASPELGPHGHVLELYGMRTEPEVGFVELGRIPAVRARPDVDEDFDARGEEQS